MAKANASMNPKEGGKVYNMMRKVKNLCLGTKGLWAGKKVSIELKPGATKPV